MIILLNRTFICPDNITKLVFSFILSSHQARRLLWLASLISWQYLGLIANQPKSPFTLGPRTEFNAHRMCIRRVHTWIRFWAMHIKCTPSQSASRGGLEPNWIIIHCWSVEIMWQFFVWTVYYDRARSLIHIVLTHVVPIKLYSIAV